MELKAQLTIPTLIEEAQLFCIADGKAVGSTR